MIDFASLSFKQHIFLQASEMMKSLTSFDFHLSLGKNINATFSRSTAKCIITNEYSWVYAFERVEELGSGDLRP